MIKIISLTLWVLLIFVLPMPVITEAASVTITSRDCQRMLRHQSSVAYKPGVDVRGKKVKPAELGGGSTFKLPEEFSFDIGVDIAEKYGLDDKNISADLKIGKITVKGRRVYMDGKPMTSNEHAALAAKCEKLLNNK